MQIIHISCDYGVINHAFFMSFTCTYRKKSLSGCTVRRHHRHRREMTARYALRFATADLARARHCGPEDWAAPHRRVVAEIPAGDCG